MDKTTKQEVLFDLNSEAQLSDINLNNGSLKGNLGLGRDWAVKGTYADFVLVEYVDIEKGMNKTKDGLIKAVHQDKTFRKGIVRVVSPWVMEHGRARVGDYVLFPNDLGLACGRVTYRDENGELKTADNAIFLNERKIFTEMERL